MRREFEEIKNQIVSASKDGYISTNDAVNIVMDVAFDDSRTESANSTSVEKLSKEHSLVVTITTAEPISDWMAKSIVFSCMNNAFSMNSSIRSTGVKTYDPEDNRARKH